MNASRLALRSSFFGEEVSQTFHRDLDADAKDKKRA
jgi:hypothetical protein